MINDKVSGLIKRVIYLRDINVEGDADSNVVYRPTKSVESDADLEGQIKHILFNIASSSSPLHNSSSSSQQWIDLVNFVLLQCYRNVCEHNGFYLGDFNLRGKRRYKKQKAINMYSVKERLLT